MKLHKNAFAHNNSHDWWHGDEMLVNRTTDTDEVLSLLGYGRGMDRDDKSAADWAEEIRNSTDFLGDLSPAEFQLLLQLIANQDTTDPLFISLKSTVEACLDE
jgi:hypothetical protein